MRLQCQFGSFELIDYLDKMLLMRLEIDPHTQDYIVNGFEPYNNDTAKNWPSSLRLRVR